MKKPTLKEQNEALRDELNDLRAERTEHDLEEKEIATLLDCEPADIVETLRTLRDDMGCDKGDTLIERADTLTSEAASCQDANKEADAARARADIYEAALSAAVADRRMLLARLGLTDYAWSAQGGACWADVEV